MCRSAWYHDRKCQQEHYKQHKQECKRLAAAAAAASTKTQLSSQQQSILQPPSTLLLFEVQETNTDKGRAMMALETLKYGTVIGPNSTNNNRNKNNWTPFVAPVLLECHRPYRCVVCFKEVLTDQQQPLQKQTSFEQYYPTRICSDMCRRQSASFLPAECQAITALQYHPKLFQPPVLLSTAILLFRLIQAVERDVSGGRLRHELSMLQSERLISSSSTKTDNHHDNNQQQQQQEERAHQQAVCATTWALMQANPSSNVKLWQLQDVEALLQQIKLNAFSICTGESVVLGFGLYIAAQTLYDDDHHDDANKSPTTLPQSLRPAPHWINHDCRPNLLQTFDYGIAGQFPSLRLTVCVDHIKPSQELTLSYIDPSMPTHLRQQRLNTDYGFQCHCDYCQDYKTNSAFVIAYKCRNNNCKGRIVFDGNDGDEVGRCDTCSAGPLLNTDRILDQLDKNLHSLDNDEHNGNNNRKNNISAWERVYQSTKKQVTPESWYFQEAGERLLQALLDLLGESGDNPQQQYEVAAQAFQVTEELLRGAYRARKGNNSSSNSTMTTIVDSAATATVIRKDCLVLRHVELLYKSIKLRLFLNIHPEASMKVLENIILPTCSTFFSSNHEMMRQIVQDCCT